MANPKVKFPTEESYWEGWKYLNSIGEGYSAYVDDLTLEPTLTGIPEEDHITMERLKGIATFGELYKSTS